MANSALDRATVFLETRIVAANRAGDRRLPPMAIMAAEGGFSTSTLSRAVRLFRDQGILTVTQRTGITIVSRAVFTGTGQAVAGRAARPEPRPRTRWHAVAVALDRDILSGAFPPGHRLPSRKELQARYACSAKTIRKALCALQDERRLVPHKRGHLVFDPPASSTTAALVLVAYRSSLSHIGEMTPRSRAFWRALEQGCRRRNLRLIVTDARDLSRFLAQRSGFPHVLGYVVWSLGFHSDDLAALLPTLAAMGKPVSILDEGGTVPLEPIVGSRSQCRIFSLATSDTAGRQLGNFLIGLGYRHVGYFSPFGKATWCRHRYDGLAQAFRHAPQGSPVERFTLDDHSSGKWITNAMASSVPFDRLTQAVKTFLTEIDPLCTGEPALLDKRTAVEEIHRHVLYPLMRPLFESALSRTSITAWVTVNDFTALMALRFLKERGLTPGPDIALASFDDSFEAFTNGLTSLDYNVSSLVHAMLGHVLSPAQRHRTAPRPPVEVPSTIMARATTPPLS